MAWPNVDVQLFALVVLAVPGTPVAPAAAESRREQRFAVSLLAGHSVFCHLVNEVDGDKGICDLQVVFSGKRDRRQSYHLAKYGQE
jgi:hypothetical protein